MLDQRAQLVDSRRNSTRLPLYLAAGRVLSSPPIIVVPWQSQTRHSHLAVADQIGGADQAHRRPDANPFTTDLLSAEISPITRVSNQPEAYRMQGPFKALQQIAFGHVMLPSGKTRRMYNYEIINLAREACDQLGIAYSNGACDPFKPPAQAAGKFAGIGQEQVPQA